MAEIHLQRKGPGAWVWIAGLIVCGILVWAVVVPWRDTVPDRGAATAPAAPVSEAGATAGAVATRPPEVTAFLTFAEEPVGTTGGPAHDYAAGGIRRLGNALNAVIREPRVEGTSVGEQVEAFQMKAARLQQNPQSGDHAEMVRDVFTSAAELMSSLQRERWSNAAELRSQIEQVRSAAEAIDAKRPLLDQTPAVDGFFDRAAAALRTMAAPREG